MWTWPGLPHGDWNMLIWGCMRAKGVGKMIFIEHSSFAKSLGFQNTLQKLHKSFERKKGSGL